MSYQTELSNLSYTNKDFSQIYPELLELVQKISYKWDPMYSDESDPGVVLLKLAAIMADKCNYNIDKNTLEQFPLSVTQQANARQLFEQCGYTMRYYNSATTRLKFRLTTEPELKLEDFQDMGIKDSNAKLVDLLAQYKRSYIIPRFTMFSDNDNSSVFTITKEAAVSSDGSYTYVEAVEGPISTLSVNGTTLISRNMLDSENRIYFPTLNVAENGIFVNNYDDETLWEAKDNLLLSPPKSKIYKFGLTLDGKRCFIEFPSDISSIIGEGLVIHYVTTSGYAGNIRSKFIKKFFNETKCSRSINSSQSIDLSNNSKQSVDLTDKNIYIVNDSAAVDGKDPETIDDAYRNYQRVKNTFSTLVTTKDYTDYLVSNKQLSNCVVCDRSDDLQSSYKVANKIEGVDQLIPHVYQKEKSITGTTTVNGVSEEVTVSTLTDEMTAFDLRVYGLTYVDAFNDYEDFRKSFNVEHQKLNYLLASTNDVKCIAHDFIPFETNKIILLKNRYPVVAKIVSSSMLTEAQKDEVRSSVRYALYQLLNSRKINFGEDIDYTAVYNTIMKADTRITAVALEDFHYETYAVYLSSSGTLKVMRIDAESVPPLDDCTSRHGGTVCGECEYCLWKKFRTEIYAKSVLQGNTSLFPPVDSFSTTLANEPILDNVIYDVDEITSTTNIPLTLSKSAITTEPSYYISNTLNENDVISVTSPNLVMDQKYSSYCQYITNIGLLNGSERKDYNTTESLPTVVAKNSDYVLQQNEYIIFFWRKTEDKNEPYTYIKYTGRDTTNPTIISPSFNMVQQTNPEAIGGGTVEINDSNMILLGDTGPAISEWSDGKLLTIDHSLSCADYMEVWWEATATNKSTDLNSIINRFIIGDRFNVKTNYIETKKVNKIHLNNDEDGTTQFYWILNNTVKVAEDKFVYRLFSADPNDREYILQEGEQLIYSDPQQSQYYILGAGTKIERTVPSNTVLVTAWDCPALDNQMQFLLDGPRYFDDDEHRWFDMKASALFCNLYATEMQFYKLGKGSKLLIQLPSDEAIPSELSITTDGIRPQHPEVALHLCSFFIENSDKTLQALPDRKNEQIAWDIKSSLNLNMSTDSPQRLYSSQKLTLMRTTENNSVTVSGSDTEQIYVQSSVPVAKPGGDKINIQNYDVLQESMVPSKLYVYKVRDPDLSLDGESSTLWSFGTDGVKISSSNFKLSNIKLEAGNYIVPVTMQYIDKPVNVYWKELRKLQAAKLTASEENLLKTTFTSGGGSVGGSVNLKLWEDNCRPVRLSDFASWVYSYMNIDISDVLSNVSVRDIVENNTKYQSLLHTGTVDVGDIVCRYKNSGGVEYQNTYIFLGDGKYVGVYRDEAGITCKVVDNDNIPDYEGKFCLRLSNVSAKGEGPTPTYNSEPLTTILDETPNTSGTYFYSVTVKDGASYTLEISTTAGDATPQFELGKLRKFTYPTLTDYTRTNLDFFTDIIARVKELDRTKRFDFIRDIPSEMLISHPLEASSFLDSKHPLNRFTICEYTISNIKRNNDLSVFDRLR